MTVCDYFLTSEWNVEAEPEEVAKIFVDAENLSLWWPAVFLKSIVLDEGDAHCIGKKVRVHTKGWLPYTMWFDFTITSANHHSFSLSALGDFKGWGSCWAEVQGKQVKIHFAWKITVEKPLLRWLSVFFKMVLIANHRWAMRRGEEGLRLELIRRRAEGGAASTVGFRGPTFPHNFPILAGLLEALLTSVSPRAPLGMRK